MAWLVTDARVLASAEVADTGRARSRGLLGRRGLDGALVLRPCHWVHTLGMKFALDVAFLDSEGEVIRIAHMRRHRMGWPVPRAHSVIEAEAGAFARWGLEVGNVVEIRE